jgi:hypothetical protein
MRRFRWWLAAHLVMLGNDLTKPETGEDPIWFVEWTLAYMQAYTKSSITKRRRSRRRGGSATIGTTSLLMK